MAGCHAGVDDPDGIGDQDGCAAGDGTCDHGFDRREFLGGAGGADGGAFEEGSSPFVPFCEASQLRGFDGDKGMEMVLGIGEEGNGQ